MRPSLVLLNLLGLWLLLSIIVISIKSFLPEAINSTLIMAWWGMILAVLCASLIDILVSRKSLLQIQASRQVPRSLALGVDKSVTLRIENNSSKPVHAVVTDQIPVEVIAANLPRQLVIEPGGHASIQYDVHPLNRGDADFGYICLRVLSRLKLWQFKVFRGDRASVKIYPNFRSISDFKTLGLHHHVGQLGVHVKQRRGQGLDFHQLREFREGDSMNQIDWKATSRVRKLISREYQDERDQDIIFLLDCGRRMRAKDSELSHFDHVLNAFLLTSHVALLQGDAVGLMTFAGQERWVKPMKGQHSVNTLLNQVYDLHSSTDTSDFVQVAQQLINKHKKRSLIILMTNLHEEDSEDLYSAIQLMSKQHLVVVANLRELFLDDNLKQPVNSFGSALNYAGTIEFASKRHRMLETIRKRGAVITDSLPQLLHIDLINAYLALKRRGVI